VETNLLSQCDGEYAVAKQ